ncbi:unnamed protein product [Gongylonema pulchrum]|uniref:Uncharacterized protein n=1 Tax=Gongylonema pulchrum TaxID=637853 RepID=A0A183E4Y6_9BILA|nr:unnamed protein product [Gongylonema pulchrum]
MGEATVAVAKTPLGDLEYKAAAKTSPSTPSISASSLTFSNPNFTLEDEENEDQLWPQKTTAEQAAKFH